ncbi:MAG TPA: Crp/Fnr family transcriptional regulator [Thiobacillaceae bacterium]|nr:Crp/Fnr family transcriptional regulator [Thiobacillaceae bacterium]
MDDKVLFDHLPELVDQLGVEHATVIVEYAEAFDLAKDEVLVRDQAPIEALYLVLQGEVFLSVEIPGHCIQLGEMGPGNWIGEVALFSGSKVASTTVTASADCQLLKLAYADFETMIQVAPASACRLAHVLIGMLIHRLRASANDPVLDPEGNLQFMGNLSAPEEVLHPPHNGALQYLKSLLGIHRRPS